MSFPVKAALFPCCSNNHLQELLNQHKNICAGLSPCKRGTVKEKYLDIIFPHMPLDTLRQIPVLASGQQVSCH